MLSRLFVPILLGVWAVGFLVYPFRQILACLLIRAKWNATRPTDEATRGLWESLLKRSPRNRFRANSVSVRFSDSLGPAIVRKGFRLMLLIPEALWEELNPATREGVLRHELAHLVHRDTLFSPLLEMLAAFQWFNPAARFALKRYDEATEWHADEFAYGNMENGSTLLAETFLALHRSTESLGLYLHSFSRFRSLDRVDRLANHNRYGKESPMKKRIIVSSMFLLLLCGTVHFRFVARAASPDQTDIEQKPSATQSTETAPDSAAAQPESPAGSDSQNDWEIKRVASVYLFDSADESALVFENGKWTYENSDKPVPEMPIRIFGSSGTFLADRENGEVLLSRLSIDQIHGPATVYSLKPEAAPSGKTSITIPDGESIELRGDRWMNTETGESFVGSEPRVSSRERLRAKSEALLRGKYVRVSDRCKTVVAGSSRETAEPVVLAVPQKGVFDNRSLYWEGDRLYRLPANVFVYVVDETGEPVVGATVVARAYRLSNPRKSFRITRSTTTDDFTQFGYDSSSGIRGAAMLSFLDNSIEPSSRLRIQAAHPDYISAEFLDDGLRTFFEKSQLEKEFRTITLHRSAILTGRVLLPDGRPANDALVCAISYGKEGLNLVQTEARCGPDGTFRIGTLPGPKRLLQIRSADAAPLVRVLKEDEAGLGTITLEAGVVLEGRALDHGGNPVANLRLNLSGKTAVVAFDRNGHGKPGRGTITQADGSFRFGPLARGDYELVAGDLFDADYVPRRIPPEAAYVNLCFDNSWSAEAEIRDYLRPAEPLPPPNRSIPFADQEITLGNEPVQRIALRGLETRELEIFVANAFFHTHTRLKWLVHGRLDGKPWYTSQKQPTEAQPLPTPVFRLSVPAKLTDAFIVLWHDLPGMGHYYPLRFRLSRDREDSIRYRKSGVAIPGLPLVVPANDSAANPAPGEREFENNWYATLGDLETTFATQAAAIVVAPYEPGFVRVACLDPSGAALEQNYFRIEYKDIAFTEPVILQEDGTKVHLGIERTYPEVEFLVHKGKPIMWRTLPVLADAEFTLHAEGFHENKPTRYDAAPQTLWLKKGERRDLVLPTTERPRRDEREPAGE